MTDRDEEYPSPWLDAARTGWSNTGARRPASAIEPGPGQESVWDYPRPPALVVDDRVVVVGDPGDPIARSEHAIRILETASPPTWYLPPDDVDMARLIPAPGESFCEWKGPARYWALSDAPLEAIGWSYPNPFPEFAAVTDFMSFYPGRIVCTVGGEKVRPQAGGFYGGWITDDLVGPFKGGPGTAGW